MRARLLLFLAAVLATAFAPAPLPRPKKDALTTLQGTWEVASVEWVGVKKGPSPTIAHVRIQGGRWTTVMKRADGKVPDDSHSTVFDLKLDSTRAPIHLDLRHRGSGPPLTGILKVEGDTITFGYAFDPPGKAARPSSFDRMERGQIVMTFRRMKR